MSGSVCFVIAAESDIRNQNFLESNYACRNDSMCCEGVQGSWDSKRTDARRKTFIIRICVDLNCVEDNLFIYIFYQIVRIDVFLSQVLTAKMVR